MFLDIFVLLVFFVSGLIAFLRGFVREALSIFGLAMALLAAYWVGPLVQPMIEGWLGVVPGEEPSKLFGILPMDVLALILSRAGVFLTVLIILSVISHFLAETIKSMGLGAVDRSLGVVFGLLRAALVVVVLYLPVHLLVEEETKDEWFGKSKTHFYVEAGAGAFANALPGDFMKEKVEQVQDNLGGEDGAISNAREKLQAMDLLREDLTPEARAQLVREKLESGELQGALQGEGYSDEFRSQIDALIQENSNAGSNLNE